MQKGRFIVLAFIYIVSTPSAHALKIEPSEEIRMWIEGKSFIIDDQKIFCKKAIPDFYIDRGFEPLWNNNDNITELIEQIKLVEEDGLNPEDYHLHYLTAHYTSGSAVSPFMDIIFTDAYFLLASHLLSGKTNPQTLHAEWQANPRDTDVKPMLSHAITEIEIAKSINNLKPQYKTYIKLKNSLKKYRTIQEEGGWHKINTGETLNPGDKDPRIAQIRQRLIVEYPSLASTIINDSSLFDASLEKAIKIFQKRHGLIADGAIGKATLSILNEPVENKIKLIILNMERCRWLPLDLGSEYILVNIANFELEAVKDGETKIQMEVIVGKPYHKTPVFSEKLRYLVFNPYWTVPPTILANDILPSVKKNPDYLNSLNMKVVDHDKIIDPLTINWASITPKNFPYQLRQDPGPNNALGIVKFIFPNPFNVYMHDTNHRELFGNIERALSSGCIRLSRPKEMASYVLKDHPNLWNEDRINGILSTTKNYTVVIQKEIQVHLLYWTCFVDEDDHVNFRKDIYERDEVLWKALQQDPPAI